MIRTAIGTPAAMPIDRVQLCALNGSIFLRVTTQAIPLMGLDAATYRNCNRWNMDGVDTSFTSRHVGFEVRTRSPITQALIIDLYLTMGQSIDVSFQRYTDSDGAIATISEPLTGQAAVTERRALPSPVDGFVRRARRRTNARIPEVVPTPPPTPEPEIPIPIKPKKRRKTTDYKPTFRNLDVSEEIE
jgi:hypothetical protein